jgi:hypothetical protein
VSQELILERFGKQLTKEVAVAAIGTRPVESWAIVQEALQLPATPEELFQLSEPQLRER